MDAFILRISPAGGDRVDEALKSNELIIGWAKAKGLLDPTIDWSQFRDIISTTYYSDEQNLRRAGNAGGHMWRFIREMKVGDLVVVPHWSEFYIAEVSGNATYDPSKVSDDTAYRRPCRWLNDGKPIPRDFARSALISRMKTQGTCAYATDILDDIRECLDLALKKKRPTFGGDLQNKLIEVTLGELRKGHMDGNRFERLIRDVFKHLGGAQARVIPKKLDKGADVVATFRVAGAFQFQVVVQAKHWQPEPPVGPDVVDELANGIEAESADLGMIVTTGTISDEAVERAKKLQEEKGVKIELVDGEQFAKLLVEHGIQQTEFGAPE